MAEVQADGGHRVFFAAALRGFGSMDACGSVVHRVWIARANDQPDHGPAGWPSRGPDPVRGLAQAEGRAAYGCGNLPRRQSRRDDQSCRAFGPGWTPERGAPLTESVISLARSH